MALSKMLEIWYCDHCTNAGRVGDTNVCMANNTPIPTELDDFGGDIPEWCPLPNALNAKEEKLKSDNTP